MLFLLFTPSFSTPTLSSPFTFNIPGLAFMIANSITGPKLICQRLQIPILEVSYCTYCTLVKDSHRAVELNHRGTKTMKTLASNKSGWSMRLSCSMIRARNLRILSQTRLNRRDREQFIPILQTKRKILTPIPPLGRTPSRIVSAKRKLARALACLSDCEVFILSGASKSFRALLVISPQIENEAYGRFGKA